MAQKAEITHTGRIVRITPTQITVEIVSESACAACHASALCGLSEATRKAIQVPASLRDDYSVGEEVDVVLRASMGHKAVWLAYAIPLVVLLAALLSALGLGASEPLAGLVATAAVALYYFVIWLLRGRLQSEYVFQIRKRMIKQ